MAKIVSFFFIFHRDYIDQYVTAKKPIGAHETNKKRTQIKWNVFVVLVAWKIMKMVIRRFCCIVWQQSKP